jgi:hypothetical protein
MFIERKPPISSLQRSETIAGHIALRWSAGRSSTGFYKHAGSAGAAAPPGVEFKLERGPYYGLGHFSGGSPAQMSSSL